MHVSALPNKYGIGSFGIECYEFIDFLVGAKQKIWEILPLCQTVFGDSPYSSCCSYSFNPYFISLEILERNGLLTKEELKRSEDDAPYIDYGKLYFTRYDLLRAAFSRFDKKNAGFRAFVRRGKFKSYALFMALKKKFNNIGFYDWPSEYKYRDRAALRDFAARESEELLFWQFLQYEAESQWRMVKGYAKANGVKIIGDLPLYVAYDSVDVWENPRIFKLDENLTPKKVAGVPPDYFSKTGQLWGNPVYNYDELAKDGFKWWVNRFVSALKNYDYVRIDHFRGFDRYYEIDYGRPDALIGEWVKVPSEKLFDSIHKRVSRKRIIAEDLGIIDDGVRDLLAKVGYPGMRILSFAFNGEEDNTYLPEKLEKNSVCYTGTHDNDTLIGLLDHFDKWDYENMVRGVAASLKKFGLSRSLKTKKALARAVIELGYASKADTFIIPLADAAYLGGEYRMNTPGREIANWTVKMPGSAFSTRVRDRLAKLTVKYKR